MDCDEKSELTPFGLQRYYYSYQYATWSDARSKCIENSSAEGMVNSHPIWATSLLVPFLINYLTTWFIWWSIDKRETVSWIAPLLSVYPQARNTFVFGKIICICRFAPSR